VRGRHQLSNGLCPLAFPAVDVPAPHPNELVNWPVVIRAAVHIARNAIERGDCDAAALAELLGKPGGDGRAVGVSGQRRGREANALGRRS
jgi:hypothetical protein